MHCMIEIGPVPRRGRARAICFLVAGQDADEMAPLRAEAFERFIRSRGKSLELWWARGDGRTSAVAAVLESPGKTGMLFFCPPLAAGVDSPALTTARVRVVT